MMEPIVITIEPGFGEFKDEDNQTILDHRINFLVDCTQISDTDKVIEQLVQTFEGFLDRVVIRYNKDDSRERIVSVLENILITIFTRNVDRLKLIDPDPKIEQKYIQMCRHALMLQKPDVFDLFVSIHTTEQGMLLGMATMNKMLKKKTIEGMTILEAVDDAVLPSMSDLIGIDVSN